MATFRPHMSAVEVGAVGLPVLEALIQCILASQLLSWTLSCKLFFTPHSFPSLSVSPPDQCSSSRYADDFISDPKKTVEEIKELLENIRPDNELSEENREGTPEAMRYPLMEHQKLGLTWMKSMEEGNNKGGILADDMGLGKTVQALALIVSRPSSDPDRKTTLIIAPVALMQQWKREVERMLRPGIHQLSVFVLHGDRRAATFKDLKKYDIVLTTFGTLASELKRKEQLDLTERREGDRDGNVQASLPILGPKSVWYRVIIDEAQCIKNRNTKAALACCSINTTYRWCMSGTPMMNCVVELHSLLKFLRIRPYCELEKFNAVSDLTLPDSRFPNRKGKESPSYRRRLSPLLLTAGDCRILHAL
jgi:SNF2 family DNA or RNA helicase